MDSEEIALLMQEALIEANKAKNILEVPVGAVILDENNKIIARAHNKIENTKFACSHAEIIALKLASEHLQNWRLTGCKIFVTMEPCIMCSGALVLSRVSEVYFGCFDQRMGGAFSTLNVCNNPKLPHQLKVTGGILEDECKQLLQDFFKEIRK